MDVMINSRRKEALITALSRIPLFTQLPLLFFRLVADPQGLANSPSWKKLKKRTSRTIVSKTSPRLDLGKQMSEMAHDLPDSSIT
jgi:hypothetical protein